MSCYEKWNLIISGLTLFGVIAAIISAWFMWSGRKKDYERTFSMKFVNISQSSDLDHIRMKISNQNFVKHLDISESYLFIGSEKKELKLKQDTYFKPGEIKENIDFIFKDELRKKLNGKLVTLEVIDTYGEKTSLTFEYK